MLCIKDDFYNNFIIKLKNTKMESLEFNVCFDKKINKVIHFSGGKTSAYMTIKYYVPGDLVIFCDTGREHEKTYKFINNFEAFENIPIIRLMYEGGFEKLLEKRAAIPNQFKRFCTLELKKRTARRYLRSNGIKDYTQLIGFRADEGKRVRDYRHEWKTVTTLFPLNEEGVTKQDVNDYWATKSYTLEIPQILGNCTLCFLKGKNAIMAILSKFPELADPWITDETRNGKHTYIKGISMQQLKELSENHINNDYDLGDIVPAMSCSCTSV